MLICSDTAVPQMDGQPKHGRDWKLKHREIETRATTTDLAGLGNDSGPSSITSLHLYAWLSWINTRAGLLVLVFMPEQSAVRHFAAFLIMPLQASEICRGVSAEIMNHYFFLSDGEPICKFWM